MTIGAKAGLSQWRVSIQFSSVQ